MASDLGNSPLAEVAKQRAMQIDNEPLTSGTLNSFGLNYTVREHVLFTGFVRVLEILEIPGFLL